MLFARSDVHIKITCFILKKKNNSFCKLASRTRLLGDDIASVWLCSSDEVNIPVSVCVCPV